MNEFEHDISIDPDGLDVELLQQSNLTDKYTRELAEKEKEVDDYKLEIDIYQADLDTMIRTGSKDKPTESAIKLKIASDPKNVKMQRKLNELVRDAKYLKGALKSIDRKDSSIHGLIKLATMNYFTISTDPRNLTEEAVRSKIRNDKIKKQMEGNKETLVRRGRR